MRLTTIEPTHAANSAAALEILDADPAAAPLAIAHAPARQVPDYALARALRALRARANPDTGRQWSNNTIAAAIGLKSGTYVSQYCGQVLDDGAVNPDAPPLLMALADFEGRVRQLLDTLADRAALPRRAADRILDTAVTRQVGAFCRAVAAARQWGLIYGASGCGKTSGLRAFAAKKPLVLQISALEWSRGAAGIERAIHARLNKSGTARRNQSRMDYIAPMLRAGEHVLLIDNAHKLTPRALHYIADLRDEFGLAVVMAGTRGVLDTLRADAQLATRIDQTKEAHWGWEYSPDKDGTRDRRAAAERRAAADALLTALAPDHAAALRAEARRIMATEEGTMRALAKRIRLMLALLDAAPSTPPAEAWAQACAQIISSAES